MRACWRMRYGPTAVRFAGCSRTIRRSSICASSVASTKSCKNRRSAACESSTRTALSRRRPLAATLSGRRRRVAVGTARAMRPHPDQWPRLSRTRIARVLQAHRIRRRDGRRRDRRLAATAAHAPPPGVADAVATRIASLVPQLLLLTSSGPTRDRQMDRAWTRLAPFPRRQPREHRDVIILRSLPGVGRTVAATMLTEAAGPLAGRDYSTLRAHSGYRAR